MTTIITAWVTRYFPLLAVIAAATAFLWPDLFSARGNLIVPLLTLIMFTMGLTLRWDNFRDVLQQPLTLLLGTLLQFLLMPALAFLLARGFALERELLTGLVLVGACPGGTASNVVCYLAKGNLALSITLTFISTLLSVVATPLLTWVWLGQAVDVPITSMMLSILQIVLVPVLAGLLLNSVFGKALAPLKPVLPSVAVIAIVFIIAIVVAQNSGNLASVGMLVMLAVILHNVGGLASAYGICRLLRHEESVCRTIAIEVGMQNSGLAVALASQYYTAVAALPGAVFSLWHNVSGSLLAGYWQRTRPDRP
jgi:BASS family bile acid:Na+ symporter